MRVTHVITRLIVGGAQENTVSTVLGLLRRPGFEVDLVSGPSEGAEGSLEKLFTDSPNVLNLEPALIRAVRPWTDLQCYLRLVERFKQTRPEIVHTHSGKAGILGRLAAKRAGVPCIIHTIHGPSFGPFQGALANAVFTNAERIAGRVTTHFITVAEAMTRQYLAAGIGRPGQYARIFSGFNLQPFARAANDPLLRARLGIKPEDFVVGKIARLFELKGHDDLFVSAPELVARIPNLKFLLVGDGPWRSRFEHMAQAMGLAQHFIFTGLVPPTEVCQYVGIMDALVHLSLREGLPRALPQAMTAGKPVVAYACDGAPEVCLDNETGYLIPPGDRKLLVQRLVQLAGSAALRHRLGETGRQLALKQFSEEGMVEAIANLYRTLRPA